jgi:hypothetical protein
MKCKGICHRFAAKRPVSGYRYAEGQKLCIMCGIFVDTNQMIILRCPCCDNKLRMKSYKHKHKHKQNTYSKKVDKYLQDNKVFSAEASSPLLIVPYN